MGCVKCYWLGMVRGSQSIPSRVQASWQVCRSGGHPHSVLKVRLYYLDVLVAAACESPT